MGGCAGVLEHVGGLTGVTIAVVRTARARWEQTSPAQG
jgi:hypothetical protein